MMNTDVSALLSRAVQIAVDNAAAGQLPFGALVVRDGTVLATGVNTALRDHDPVAHAEVAAVPQRRPRDPDATGVALDRARPARVRRNPGGRRALRSIPH
jgi:tRNA(Arg) A34 adenosine deaminase TadA